MEKPSKWFRAGVVLQAVASFMVGAGITMEAIAGGDIWLILITAGSFVFGIACKLMRI